MKVFIAEDAPPARERLVEALSRVAPQVHVVGHADSVKATADWLATQPPPDLLLLDIQLSDGLSLELFDGRNGSELAVPVIFTTAFDQFAIAAFRAAGGGLSAQAHRSGKGRFLFVSQERAAEFKAWLVR